MAVKLDERPLRAEDAEVSNCVGNLIQAFTNGLNIFKRLRERRQKRKARKDGQQADAATNAELQLTKSLRKGPQELVEKYETCYGQDGMGSRFAKGDAIAHASLAETLIRLNTGLVGIITTFLNHDSKSGKSHLDLDYRSLTNLSDASRKEALQSLSSLYQRLSHSQLQLYRYDAPVCATCGSSKHAECETKKKTRSPRRRSSAPKVTRMPIKSSSQSQLVVVRPKASRKGSSSSQSSSNSNSSRSSSSSTHISPINSPTTLHATSPPRWYPIQTNGVIKGTLGAWPLDSAMSTAKTPMYAKDYPQPIPSLPVFRPTPRGPLMQSPSQLDAPSQHKSLSPQSSPPHSAKLTTLSSPIPSHKSTNPSPTPATSKSPYMPPLKRRSDKATPSSYTFASDSTKLGEIPSRHWTTPWDADEAARLNALDAAALANTVPGVVVSAGEDKTRKKGLFGFLRRGGGDGV